MAETTVAQAEGVDAVTDCEDEKVQRANAQAWAEERRERIEQTEALRRQALGQKVQTRG